MGVRLDQHFLLMYELKVNKCLPLASLGYPQCAMSSPQGLILLSCDMCAKPPIEIDNLFSLPLFELAFSHHLLPTQQLRHSLPPITSHRTHLMTLFPLMTGG